MSAEGMKNREGKKGIFWRGNVFDQQMRKKRKKKIEEGKYLVSGGDEEQRKKGRIFFGEEKYLVSRGEEERRRKRKI